MKSNEFKCKKIEFKGDQMKSNGIKGSEDK